MDLNLSSQERALQEKRVLGTGSCRLLQCCEPTAEERGAVKPHATFCGNRGRVTASGDPVATTTHSCPRVDKRRWMPYPQGPAS